MSTSEGGGCHEPKSAPVFLPVGAAVSAKYRGAFCEASIEGVTLNYRIRVQLKDKKVRIIPLHFDSAYRRVRVISEPRSILLCYIELGLTSQT